CSIYVLYMFLYGGGIVFVQGHLCKRQLAAGWRLFDILVIIPCAVASSLNNWLQTYWQMGAEDIGWPVYLGWLIAGSGTPQIAMVCNYAPGGAGWLFRIGLFRSRGAKTFPKT
ncbi:MAG: hypothetical protein MRY59_12145, partial [Aquisalinus sp.]|nr:hypothetical protein [Aquisalinus sp.]